MVLFDNKTIPTDEEILTIRTKKWNDLSMADKDLYMTYLFTMLPHVSLPWKDFVKRADKKKQRI